MHANSNHKLALSTMTFKWIYSTSVRRSECLNHKFLHDTAKYMQYWNETEKQLQYWNETENQLSQQQSPTNIQGRWKNIVATITKTPYKKKPPFKTSKRHCTSNELLSELLSELSSEHSKTIKLHLPKSF